MAYFKNAGLNTGCLCAWQHQHRLASKRQGIEGNSLSVFVSVGLCVCVCRLMCLCVCRP